MFIGITLLYSVSEDSKLYGVLKSYIVKIGYKQTVTEIAFNKAKEQIKLFYPNYKYIGLEDIFAVTGQLGEGELLGRSTLYEFSKISNAKELVKDLDGILVSTTIIPSHFCASLVYFYEGKTKKETSFVFTILIILKESNLKDAYMKALDLAGTDITFNKIIQISSDNLDIKRIKFVGIEDLYAIEEDMENGGSFQVFYNDEFQSEKEMLKILPSEGELNDMIKDTLIIKDNELSPR